MVTTVQQVQALRQQRDAAMQAAEQKRREVGAKEAAARAKFQGRVGSQILIKRAVARDRAALRGLENRVRDLSSQVLRANRRFQKRAGAGFKPKTKKRNLIAEAKVRTIKRAKEKKITAEQIKRATAKEKALKAKKTQVVKAKKQILTPAKVERKIATNVRKQQDGLTRAQVKKFFIAAGKKIPRVIQESNKFQNKVLFTPVDYGKNLVKRGRRGERNPFFNDVKEVTREFKVATWDTGYAIGGFLGKFTRKSVVGSFNYGRNIQREAQRGNFVLDDDIKKLGNKLYSGARTTAQVTGRTAKFVKANPVATGVIIGSTTKEAGSALVTKFKKDPVETTISALLLKGVKVSAVASKTPIGRAALEFKFIRGQPKELRPFVKAIIKGAKAQEKLSPTKVKKLKKLNFNEVRALNPTEARAVKKALRETDSFVFGSLPSRAISGGKTKLPKDVDLATKSKSKFIKAFLKNIPAKSRKQYKVKGEKLFGPKGEELFDIKGYDRLRPQQSVFGTGTLPVYENVAKKGKAISLRQSALGVQTQPLAKIDDIRVITFGEQTTRKGLGTLQVLIEKNARRAKDPAAFIESLKIQLAALKGQIPKNKIGRALNFPKTLKAKQLEKSIKLLESKSFAKQLDKAVPGLTKEFPIITRTKRVAKAARSKTIKARITKKIKALKAKPKTAKKSVVPKSRIPKSRIPKSRIPKSRVPKSRVPKSRVPKSRVPKSRVPRSRVPRSKVPTSRTPTSKTPRSKLPPSKTPPSKTPPSRGPPSKIPPSRGPPSKLPPSRPPTKKTPPIKPIVLRLSLNNLPRKGSRQGYIVRIKKGSKILAVSNTPLPKNRAINVMRTRVDNTPAASGEIIKRGKTSIVDVKRTVLGKKFRPKKSKNKLVRIQVEKRKFRKDTAGEKKGIKRKKKR